MNDMFYAFAPRDLRPHQSQAIDMLRQSIGKGLKRVVLQAPTGFGKSITAAKIIESALAKGHRVLFTVPRLSLVNQTVAEFMREGIAHIGVLQGNHPRTDYDAPVQVATVQTLAKRMIPDDFGLVIVDECHETFGIIYELMTRWPSVPFVGLSATPWAKGMGLKWQELRVAVTIKELIATKFLSEFTAYAADIPDLSQVKSMAGEYAESGLEDVMSDGSLVASVVETWLAKGENRPTLCYGVNRAHAKLLQEQFMRAGVSAGYCDAFTDIVERQHLERQFRAGEVRVACSVRTLTTGIDWPVSCISDAAPTKSEMLHVQKIGRGLRINPGTEDLIILDHASNSLRLGLVTEIYHDTLDTSEKGKPAVRVKAEKLPKECANCGALHVGLLCPFCGNERKPVAGIETVDGELIEITGKAKPATMADKQRFWSMALHLDGERNKGGKLAKGLYRGKYGVWPRGLGYERLQPDAAFMNYEHASRIRYVKSLEKKGDAA